MCLRNNSRTFIAVLVSILFINGSLFSQSLTDSLNKANNSEVIDTLESITIIEVDRNIIEDFINITKSLKHHTYNKFHTDYIIIYKRNSTTDSSYISGKTIFVPRPNRPSNFYYPLLDNLDSAATHLSAWNIHLGGYATYYVEMPSKLFQSAQKNRMLLLSIYKDEKYTYFTIIDRRKNNETTTITYDTGQKEITQIRHSMSNTSFLDINFDSVETIIKVSTKGKKITPIDIKSIIRTADQTISIHNFNLTYSYITPKEYKQLVKIGVYKK